MCKIDHFLRANFAKLIYGNNANLTRSCPAGCSSQNTNLGNSSFSFFGDEERKSGFALIPFHLRTGIAVFHLPYAKLASAKFGGQALKARSLCGLNGFQY
jgi:hypothetical protein